MQEYFAKKKSLIACEVERLILAKRAEFGRVNEWGEDVARRLATFTLRGKMVRGGLLLLGREMFSESGSRETRSALRAAAAIEILHSALLIHDDIMDNDRVRRGMPTIFAQYERLADRAGSDDAERIGRNMGICAGDVGFFIAWENIASLPVSPSLRASLLELVSKELAYVGLAQMRDVSAGTLGESLTRDSILRLYLYKTARYTFSLPLMCGATLAGAGTRMMRKLSTLGERLGIVFQMRDDELGIFGAQRRVGKPIGSDIREGRMTLLYLELLEKAGGEEREALEALLGSRTLSVSSLERIRRAVDGLGVRERLAERMNAELRGAERIISALPIRQSHRAILQGICRSSSLRQR